MTPEPVTGAVTRIVRLLAALLLLVALTAATSRGCAGEAGPAPRQQGGNADDSGVKPGPTPKPKPRPKPTPTRAPTIELTRNPQQHNPRDRDFYLVARSNARTAHVTIKVIDPSGTRTWLDREVIASDDDPATIHITLHPNEALTFEVLAIRFPSTVACAILNADLTTIDEDPPPGEPRKNVARCYLAPLQ